MPKPNAIFFTTFTANVNVPGVTETVVATLGGIDVPYATSTIALIALVQLTPGADQTSAAIAIRRGTVSGTLVGEANAQTFAAAGSQVIALPLLTTDAPGDVASQVYVVTIVQAGGVANGSALQGGLLALVS